MRISDWSSDVCSSDLEAGFKATWLDRKLRTNIALFHAWQTGVQRNAAALTDLETVTQYIVNAGDARVWGAEFEVVAMPWQGMEITGNLRDRKSTRLNSSH